MSIETYPNKYTCDVCSKEVVAEFYPKYWGRAYVRLDPNEYPHQKEDNFYEWFDICVECNPRSMNQQMDEAKPMIKKRWLNLFKFGWSKK